MESGKGIKLNYVLEKYGTVPYVRYRVRNEEEKKMVVGSGQMVRTVNASLNPVRFIPGSVSVVWKEECHLV